MSPTRSSSLALLALTVACAAAGCGGAPAPSSSEAAGGEAAGAPVADERTRRMAELLRERYESTGPTDDAYDSARQVAWLKSRPVPEDPRRRDELRLELTRQLVNAGETVEALELLRELREAYAADPANRARLDYLIGVASLRLAEQQNCVAHHSADSCLLPIRGSGRHGVQEGSRQAKEALLAVLAAGPPASHALSARWLLNVAAMTLGEWPEGVPPEYLIPPRAFESDHPLPRFVNVAKPAGLDVTGLSGGGVTEDLDGDGLLDVVVSSWGPFDQLRAFRNAGDGTFVETTASAGLEGVTGGLNLIDADYDGDGDVDVLVLRGAWRHAAGLKPDSLLQNDGMGRFADVTVEAGLLAFSPGQTAAWGDYDNDGWLDLYVGAESSRSGGTHPCRLYRNDGDGSFSEVAERAGAAVVGYVKAVVWGDYDNDGRLDLYLSRLGLPNVLLHNEGPDAAGTWRFRETTAEAGVAAPLESFPAAFFDYDNDGWLDLFVSGYGPLDRGAAADVAADYLGQPAPSERPRLYRNRGDGTFEDMAPRLGLDVVAYTMGCNFGDLDNDGWLDLYLGTGDPSLESIVPNRMFRNDAGRAFQDVTTAGGFGHLQKGHAISFADLDNDGDQDVHAVMGGAYSGDTYQNALFENPGTPNRWVTLMLEGTRANRSAIGARVRLDVATPAGPRSIHRVVGTGGSFGASSLRLETGLGQASALERVEVRWPGSGTVQVFDNLAMERVWRLREEEPEAEPVELPAFDLGGGAAASR